MHMATPPLCLHFDSSDSHLQLVNVPARRHRAAATIARRREIEAHLHHLPRIGAQIQRGVAPRSSAVAAETRQVRPVSRIALDLDVPSITTVKVKPVPEAQPWTLLR